MECQGRSCVLEEKMDVFADDIADLEKLQKPIEVRIGPSKSNLIKELLSQYRNYQFEFKTNSKGTVIVLHFNHEERYELWV